MADYRLQRAEGAQMKTFEDLKVFKRSYRVSLELHRLSLEFPKHEQTVLADQIRRSSKSIPALLAEGWGKRSSQAEFRRFVEMAVGSADELRVWLRYALDLGYMEEGQWQGLSVEYKEIAKMLVGLSESLRS